MAIMAEQQNRTFKDQFMLRLPDGMRDKIRTAAESSGRSMNAEIVHRLERSFEYLETHHIKPVSEGGEGPENTVLVTPVEHRMLHVLQSLEEQVAELKAETDRLKNAAAPINFGDVDIE